ncbi:MAG TPA: hypothetical protein VKH61_19635, partial [Streptosporangiaceae bacterium]|nr:hypothetical protein [Streptosporangiaceae bacterium]
MLLSGKTLRHVLVIGVDGVRFDLLGLAGDGGPLFAEAARREFVAASEVSLEAWNAADEAVTELAASILAEEGPRLSFVYLGAADVVGHVLGAGSA